jgi:ABC-type branched-subunit amino acid transport system substrate-binding protein
LGIGRSAGAPVPQTGRYAAQGAQVRLGLELWATHAGAELELVDDASDPARSAEIHARLAARHELVLGPYGSDSTRAVAAARPAVLWNHGAAADDVQRLPGVVSLPTPASRYLVAAAAAVPRGASIAIVAAGGPFAQSARGGLVAHGLPLAGDFALSDDPASIAAAGPDAVLACGPVEREVALFVALAPLLPDAILGGVSPGLAAFPDLVGGDPDGYLAPVQWHPDLDSRVELGPTWREIAKLASGPLDYVGAQAYAAALVAARCLELEPADPLSAARRLRTSTFFGAFELDSRTGAQRGHSLAVVRWRGGRQELLLRDAA